MAGAGIDDLPFRRGMAAVRWMITLAYMGLAGGGVLHAPRQALLLSGAVLVADTALFTWLRVLRPRMDARALAAFRYVDVLLVSAVLVSLHDARNPVWSIYFISITAMAHMATRREILSYVAWVGVNYLGAALAIEWLGYGVPWAYVIVVSASIQIMGLNALVRAGGEARLRGIIADLAVTDALTGLPNRRQFHGIYAATLGESMASREPLALMLLDVDHFKEINDERGHPAGDDKLRELAAAMRETVRRGDLVARFGGDEFIVVAPRTSRGDARGLAQRLRDAAQECGTSVSVGFAIFPEDAQREDALIAAADAALYAAKQAGRNCVREAA